MVNEVINDIALIGGFEDIDLENIRELLESHLKDPNFEGLHGTENVGLRRAKYFFTRRNIRLSACRFILIQSFFESVAMVSCCVRSHGVLLCA
ncbi:hypothetical protein AVEN_115400-1 [Araneus ventricosus]|uniref:Uncharacterized protein n=1 Tax=Araneus ventricosus TaxID=182803 RepID=A0A4Y1ZYX2_ARAVE|nr:hypothetical protein AVEN_115400-1 [Araneus ventricosus]